MADQLDIFGDSISTTGTSKSDWLPTNDMGLVEEVLRNAVSDAGFMLVGPSERVYRKRSRDEIEAAPAHHGDVVHQFLRAGWLTKGGAHSVTCGPYSGSANSVLVPRKTKEAVARWRTLTPLPRQAQTSQRKAS